MSEPQPEPAGGPYLRTTPATKVTFWNDGRIQFTDPDGTETWVIRPDDEDDDYDDPDDL